MANICGNIIIFEGEKENIEKIKSILFKDNNFNFENLIPYPKNLNNDELYYWFIGNWGSTSNAFDIYVEHNKNLLKIYFSTNWSPPFEIYKKLFDIAEKENVKLIIEYNVEAEDPEFLWNRIVDPLLNCVQVAYVDNIIDVLDDFNDYSFEDYIEEKFEEYGEKWIIKEDDKEFELSKEEAKEYIIKYYKNVVKKACG